MALGDTSLLNMTNAVPASVFADNAGVFLRVWFSTDDETYLQLTPDVRVTSQGYALSAAVAETVADDAVTAAAIADGAVGPDALAADAVTSTQIADGTV